MASSFHTARRVPRDVGRGARAALWAWLLGGVAVGCAPSHRMVHDGDVYFEHCYSADFNQRVRADQREACWNAWLAHYTRHQPSHRIDYAMRRVESLENGEPAPVLPELGSGDQMPSQLAPEDEALITLAGPRAGAEASTTLAAGNTSDLTHGCELTCAEQAQRCTAACPADATRCPDLCDREKALCRGGCY